MKRILYTVVIVFCAGMLFAQTDNLEPIDTNKFLNVTTGEIIVTSTRVENMIKEIPLPIEVTSSEEILNSTSNTLPEILTSKPGITFSRDGIWATDINIRGLSKYNIVILIDGTRLETATDLSARLSLIDLSDIDRVEIIKGGASSLYGTGATGGVINIFSKTNLYNAKHLLSGSFSSGFNTVNKNPFARINLNLSTSKFYLKLNGTLRTAENTNTPKGEIPNSQYRDNYWSAGIGFIPFKNHELVLNYQRYDAMNVGIPGGFPLFPNNAVVTYPRELRELYSAEYKVSNVFKSLKNISAKYYYSFILRDVDNIPNQVTIKPPTSTTPKQRISVLDIRPVGKHYVNGIQLQTEWIPFANHNLVAGFDIWQRQFDSQRERSQRIETYDSLGVNIKSTVNKITGEKPVPESQYRSYGVYAQDEIKLAQNKLKLNIGGRVDWINITSSLTYQPVYEIVNGIYNYKPTGQKILWNATDVNNTSWSVNAGGLYNLLKDFDVTLNVSRSFRSPSLEERYQYIDLGSYLRVGNPDLNSEQSMQFDIGARVWKEHFSFTGNIFYNTFSDLVVEMPGTYEGRPAYIKQNVGSARLYGFDFDLMYSFHKNYIGYLSAAYVRGEDTGNETDLPQIPPLNLRVGLKTGVIDFLIIDFAATIFDAQDKVSAGEYKTPGYATFDFSVNTIPLELKFGTLQFFTGVQNILDKDYRNHLATNRGSVTIEPGRNFFLKANVTF